LFFCSVFFAAYLLYYLESGILVDFNKWLEDVEEMSPWFNRMFLCWLFANDRKRWAKWASKLVVFLLRFAWAV
jgi:hypothetical protein